jgi:hydroxyacylglutathione hydrolase
VSTPSSDTAGLPQAPEVVQMEVGLMQNFCEILWCPETREAALIDPAWEVDRLLRESDRLKLRITRILITHTHNDHIDGVAQVVARTGAVTHVHPREADRLTGLAQTIVPLQDRQDIPIGQRGVRALETPGHTVGGTCFLADGYLITGDVLFVGGCGRTDFPGGNTRALWDSLQRLLALPEETRVYPGHDYGPHATSTLSRESLENPYLLCRSFEAFRTLRERIRKA